MRPLRLAMQAFGPYRGREVVDFAELGLNRVFLIHGDTGAGKTTILDAMVFALYDETSGGERSAGEMRCDSAPADLPTEVTFDFSLGERSFRIRRRPAQEVAGVRSAGMVSKQAEVALWERTGYADAQAEGRPLGTKKREVDERVRELLGFSCDQFRQVVVLPQGRFRELLREGSDRREEILRQLFRTERFRELEVVLAERAKTVRRQMEDLDKERRWFLGSIGAEDDAGLATLSEQAVAELEAASQELAERAAAADSAHQAVKAAEKALEAHQAVAEARRELEALESESAAVETARLRLERGRRAEKARSARQTASDRALAREQAEAAAAQAAQELEESRQKEREAAGRLAAESERAAARQAAAAKVRELEALGGKLERLREAEAEHDSSGERLACVKRATGEARALLEQAEAALTGLREKLRAGEVASAQVETARSRLEHALQVEDRCRRYSEACAKVGVESERLRALNDAEAVSLDALRQAEHEQEECEQRWRAGRAGALAATLQLGQPCPVCGSTEHPAPAVASEEGARDEDLEACRAATALTRREFYEVSRKSAACRAALDAEREREAAIGAEPGPGKDLSLERAAAEVKARAEELERLVQEAEVGGLQAASREAEQKVREGETAAKSAAEAEAEAAKDYARSETRLGERAAAVPEELRGAGALELALDQALATQQELETAFAQAQASVDQAKDARVAAQEAEKSAAAALTKASEGEVKAKQEFQVALAARGFADEADWQAAWATEEELGGLEAQVSDHQAKKQNALGRLQQAEKTAQGQPEPGDVQTLRKAAQGADSMHTMAMERQAEARGRLQSLEDTAVRLADIDDQAGEVRKVYEVAGMLAEVAEGKKSGRISFQRWVLGVYLDEVLATAGRKLYAMSKGRFLLERQRETADHGRPSGLDLAVFDEFSGVSRSAVTLSGGESFLAALALALGLAETVQEHAAGIPLETIFVDEGFGALDADALELAVDALMELQSSGRLVGVISHVPELRQVIPARLEVHGGPGGSSTRFIVP